VLDPVYPIRNVGEESASGFFRSSKNGWENAALAGYGISFSLRYINSANVEEMNNVYYFH